LLVQAYEAQKHARANPIEETDHTDSAGVLFLKMERRENRRCEGSAVNRIRCEEDMI
jgi:hypothetical protein